MIVFTSAGEDLGAIATTLPDPPQDGLTTMTTETKHRPRDPGLGVLLGAASVALGAGALLVLVAGLTGGRPEALGAAVGAGATITVLAFGSFVVHVVATVMPSASVLVALLTYALQIVVLGAVFLGLSRSGELGEGVHREWLAAGLVAGTLVWTVAQIWLGARARIPLYDLPVHAAGEQREAGAR